MTPPETGVADHHQTEGEQFANAYFDTETKIKMFVPPIAIL